MSDSGFGFLHESDLDDGDESDTAKSTRTASTLASAVESNPKVTLSSEQKCLCCPEPRKKKQKFCTRHESSKRLYIKDELKDYPESEKPAQKKKLEHELKDDTVAAAKIKAYDEKNPPRGRGIKRVSFDGAQTSQSFAHTKAKEKDNVDKMMDLIEYAKMKERDRGWDFERSKKSWDTLRLDPKLMEKSDNLGEEKGFELRLPITVGSYIHKKDAISETASLTLANKKQKILTDEKLEESQQNLMERWKNSIAAPSAEFSLGSGSFLQGESEFNVVGSMSKARDDMKEKGKLCPCGVVWAECTNQCSPDQAGAAGSPAANPRASGPAAPLIPVQSANGKAEGQQLAAAVVPLSGEKDVDIFRVRLKKKNQLDKELAATVNNIKNVVQKATEALQCDLIDSQLDRAVMDLLELRKGLLEKLSAEVTEKSDLESTEANLASAVEATPLSDAAKAKADCLHSIAWVKIELQEEIGNATTKEAVETIMDQWKETSTAIKEIIANTNSLAVDLKKAPQQRKLEQKRQEEKDKKAEEKRKKEMEESQTSAAAKEAQALEARMGMKFLFDLAIPQVVASGKNDGDWKTEWASTAEPWAIAESESVGLLTADPQSRITLQKMRFENQYRSAIQEDDGRVIAPVVEDWLQKPLHTLVANFAPDEKVPLADKAVKKRDVPLWWGMEDQPRVSFGFERHGLPSLLMNLGCAVRIIIAPADKLLGSISENEVTIKNIHEALAKATEAEIAGDTGMLYTMLGANGILFIPAGWHVWATAQRDNGGSQRNCFGWRCSLNPTKANAEVGNKQIANMDAAAKILQSEQSKMEGIVVKSKKVERKIKQLQTDIAAMEEAQKAIKVHCAGAASEVAVPGAPAPGQPVQEAPALGQP